jgi:hypothetical protein
MRRLHRDITLVWADGGYTGGLVGWCRDKLALTLEIVKRTDDMEGFVVLPRLLWNLICQVVQPLPWLTATIGRSVAVAGTPISRGVAPVGVGTSTSRSSSWSSAA